MACTKETIDSNISFSHSACVLHVFNEQSRVMVEKLRERCGTGTFNIFPYITLCALDIICETAMGKQLNAQTNSDSEYVKYLYKISELIQERQKSPWFWPDQLYNLFGNGKEFTQCLDVLHGFTEQVIKARAAELDVSVVDSASAQPEDEMGSKKRKRLALLDLLLAAAKDDASLGYMDIREEVDTFMFEGHDTTAAAMAWVMFLVGNHADVQKKIHEELDTIFGDDMSRDVTMNDIKQMKYLECVIKESLRLFPSVPFMGRVFSEDCEIGQKFAMNEEKVLVSSILRNFCLKCSQTESDVRPVSELVLRPEKGIEVELALRA